MEFIREIKRVEDNFITIHLPDRYKSWEVEVLVLPFDEMNTHETVRESSFESLKYISIDTRKYKFNREELYER